MSKIVPLARSSGLGAVSLHDEMISSLPNQQPRWLVEGRLQDHMWRIATDDLAKKLNATFTIHHNAIIAPGLRLCAPEREHDLLTSKMLAYSMLEPPYNTAAQSTMKRVQAAHWLMRWRDQLGLFRMSDLNRDELFQKWGRDIRFGLRGLLDMDRRIGQFINDVEDGVITLPLRETVRGFVAIHDEVAAHLGIQSLNALEEKHYLRLLGFFAAKGVLDRSCLDTLELLKQTAEVEPLPRGREQMTMHLRLWESLWKARDLASHDPLGYNPFRTISPWMRTAEFAENRPQRTKTAPEEQVCFLVDRALRWVLEYSNAILITLDAIMSSSRDNAGATGRNAIRCLGKDALKDLHFDGPGAPRAVFRDAIFRTGARKRMEGDELSFHEIAFELLPTACAIIVATFTARRREEIVSLQDDCIQLDGEGEPWMLTWIEKTLRDLDRIPVPGAVVRAIEVLKTVSGHARQMKGQRWLFRYVVPLYDREIGYQIGPAIKRFADYVEVPPLPDGSRWDFAPHQFRRFFAIVYYHRFRYASLTALSAFLKHYDPDMTRRYITEATKGGLVKVREAADAAANQLKELRAANKPEDIVAGAEQASNELERAVSFLSVRQRDFEATRLEAEFSRMWATATGDEMMGGHKGEALKTELEKMIQQARRQIELAPTGGEESEVFNVLLRDFVKTRFFEPHPQGHSYCGCGRTAADLTLAACLREKALAKGEEAATVSLKPDYAFADARTCSGCHHNIQMEENRRWWEQRLRSSLLQAQTAVTEHFGYVARTHAEICQSHIQRCFERARPMSITLGKRGCGNG